MTRPESPSNRHNNLPNDIRIYRWHESGAILPAVALKELEDSFPSIEVFSQHKLTLGILGRSRARKIVYSSEVLRRTAPDDIVGRLMRNRVTAAKKPISLEVEDIDISPDHAGGSRISLVMHDKDGRLQAEVDRYDEILSAMGGIEIVGSLYRPEMGVAQVQEGEPVNPSVRDFLLPHFYSKSIDFTPTKYIPNPFNPRHRQKQASRRIS
jgi:hypothetical protein